jgi:hypothetical protein
MKNTQVALERTIQEKKDKDLVYRNMHGLCETRLDHVMEAFYKLSPSPPITIPRRKSIKPEVAAKSLHIVTSTEPRREYKGYSVDSPSLSKWARMRSHSRGGTASSAASTNASIMSSEGESSPEQSPDRIADIDVFIETQEDDLSKPAPKSPRKRIKDGVKTLSRVLFTKSKQSISQPNSAPTEDRESLGKLVAEDKLRKSLEKIASPRSSKTDLSNGTMKRASGVSQEKLAAKPTVVASKPVANNPIQAPAPVNTARKSSLVDLSKRNSSTSPQKKVQIPVQSPSVTNTSDYSDSEQSSSFRSETPTSSRASSPVQRPGSPLRNTIDFDMSDSDSSPKPKKTDTAKHVIAKAAPPIVKQNSAAVKAPLVASPVIVKPVEVKKVIAAPTVAQVIVAPIVKQVIAAPIVKQVIAAPIVKQVSVASSPVATTIPSITKPEVEKSPAESNDSFDVSDFSDE